MENITYARGRLCELQEQREHFIRRIRDLKRLIKAYVDENDIKAIHSYTSDLSFNLEECKKVECDIKTLCKKWGLNA